MRRKKRAYLHRLIAIIILVLLPALIFFNIFWQRSFREMEKRNEAYYEKLMDSFTDNFKSKLSELKLRATEISVGSKDPKSAFWRGTESFHENEYWYYEAVREIKEYSNPYVSAYGIYYYDMDCIITSGGTQTAQQYIRTTLNVTETEAGIWHYFDRENYRMGELVFSTTNGNESTDGKLLAGYCNTMGKNQDPVLIFYVISPDDFGEAMDVICNNNGVNFYVLEKESGQICLALGEAAQNESIFLADREKERDLGGIVQKMLYQKDIGYLALSFAMYITEDSPQNDMAEFYHDMKIVLLVTILVLFLVCIIGLYAAYKPVYKLSAELDYADGNEFDVIRSTLDDHNARIQEQEMLILDLLVKHLLYGVPISENRVKRLGIAGSIQYYCVFVLEGHVLLSGEVEQITEEMEKSFSARMFVTDWQGENRSILIAFLEQPDISGMQEWLNRWLEVHLMEEYAFSCGRVVDKMDEIRSSLLSCTEKKSGITEKGQEAAEYTAGEEIKSLNSRKEQQEKKKEEILNYLEAHYRDADLSQTQVADAFQISNYTLSRMFKNQVGVGFTEYVNAKRLEYARELLLTTSFTVREISAMVGFANDNYFSRIFKATVGMSPTAFREQ